MSDTRTRDYFESFTPHYAPERFEFAIRFLQQHGAPDQALLDVGCGDGATMYQIARRTPLHRLTGLDLSGKYLRKARDLVACETLEGSILDEETLDRVHGRYDYCTLGAVLHHVVGKTRRESYRLATRCLANAARALKPGGYLMVFEPTHGPAWLMTVLFWVKRLVGSLVSGRLEILSRWANIGRPVVSYYTPDQLQRMFDNIGSLRVVHTEKVDESRMGFLIRRVGLGIVLQKKPD
ncbi:MAG: class I SAM-dependent methyltransferase [Candidatus Brocadiia bacterium]